MITIPNRQTKKITQTNRSKILGDIWSSFNLDLQSDLGLIKVSPRLQVNTSGVANQGLPVAFSTFGLKVFALCDTRIFSNSTTGGNIDATTTFTEDAGTGAITTYSKDTGDLKTFNSCLCATAQTKLMSLTGTTWTQRATINTGAYHKMTVFTKNNRLYYMDFDTSRSVIKSLDTSWSEATSGSYFIDLTNSYEFGVPYTIDSDGTDIWVGTTQLKAANYSNQYSGAYILRWDGYSSTITTPYRIKARGVLALCKDDRNIMHAIDTNGALLQFTGSGFEEIGRLPLKRELLANTHILTYVQPIHPNGLQFTRNGTFIVLVNNLNGDSSGTINENLPSGIWEWSKETGFVHRQSISYNPMATSTITDYGQNRVSAVGALTETDLGSAVATGNPTLLAGANYYTDATTVASGIFIDDPFNTVQKYGYFVSTWIQSQNLKDTWQKAALKYRKFLDSADKIWVKYRTTEAAPVAISLTWINTTSFSTATDLTAYVGQEIEIIQGTGSGKCAHIVSCQGSGATVTLDESFTGVTTGTAKARVQAWKKSLVTDDLNSESMIKSLGDVISERVQIKCCMQFTGEDELHELIIINKPHDLVV